MKAPHAILMAFTAASLLAPAFLEARSTEGAMKDTALLIIDIQNFYFEGGRVPLVGSIEASRQAQKLLQACRDKGILVVHIRHLPKDIPRDGRGLADAQYAIHKNVAPRDGEKVIGKHYANSFRDTELKGFLDQKAIRRLIICGMQTHMCVEAAVRAAADLGFEVIVVEDACATQNLKYKDVETDARHVHAAVLAALKDTYAQILTTDEMLKSLAEVPPK